MSIAEFATHPSEKQAEEKSKPNGLQNWLSNVGMSNWLAELSPQANSISPKDDSDVIRQASLACDKLHKSPIRQISPVHGPQTQKRLNHAKSSHSQIRQKGSSPTQSSDKFDLAHSNNVSRLLTTNKSHKLHHQLSMNYEKHNRLLDRQDSALSGYAISQMQTAIKPFASPRS